MKARKPEKAPPLTVEEGRAMGRADVAKGYAWNAAFTIPAKFLFPIIQIFLYRKLGPVEFGIFAVLSPIYTITESLRDAGLALTYVADRKNEREGQYASLAMLNAIVFAALIFFFRGAIARAFAIPEAEWGVAMVAFAVLITGFSTIPANKLQKLARFRDVGLVDFLSTAASCVVAIVMWKLGFGYKALVWQFVAKTVLFTVACWAIQPVHFAAIRFEVIKAVWKHATHNLLNNLMFTIYTMADNLLIARLYGPGVVGNYNAAFTLGMKPVEFFSSPLAKTLLIAYTRKSDDTKGLTNVFTRTICVSILCMVPLFAVIWAFANPLVLWIFGSKYPLAGVMLAMLAIYSGCRSVGLLCGNVLVSMNKPVFNVYGWVLALLTVAAILLCNRGHWNAIFVVGALTAGGVVSYATTAAAAFAVLRPSGENAKKLWQALGLSCFTGALGIAAAWLPFGSIVNCVLAVVVVGAMQAVGAGLIYTGTPKSCFSKSGLKRVYLAL